MLENIAKEGRLTGWKPVPQRGGKIADEYPSEKKPL
jgi:hypothetical protein